MNDGGAKGKLPGTLPGFASQVDATLAGWVFSINGHVPASMAAQGRVPRCQRD